MLVILLFIRVSLELRGSYALPHFVRDEAEAEAEAEVVIELAEFRCEGELIMQIVSCLSSGFRRIPLS